jgi:hypothetical protein
MGGYLVFFCNTLISGKQHIVAHSSIEADYKALAYDIDEVLRL